MISRLVSMMASTGVWLLLDDAAKHLGVPFCSEWQFKKSSALDVSRLIERGARCSSVAPFCSFDYAFLLKDAPAGWKAFTSTQLTLPEFINLCKHLGNNKIHFPVNSVTSSNFQKYTGKSLNLRNIQSAFTDGVLYSSQALGEKLLLKQRTAKRTCKGICHPQVNARASSDPGWCRQVGVELQNSTWHHVLCGCSEGRRFVKMTGASTEEEKGDGSKKGWRFRKGSRSVLLRLERASRIMQYLTVYLSKTSDDEMTTEK